MFHYHLKWAFGVLWCFKTITELYLRHCDRDQNQNQYRVCGFRGRSWVQDWRLKTPDMLTDVNPVSNLCAAVQIEISLNNQAEGLCKVTGSFVRWKSSNISETLQDKDMLKPTTETTNKKVVYCPYKLYKPYSSGIRSSFFCERITNLWNSLPADVGFSSVNTFKIALSVLILPSFIDGVCGLCFIFFRAAVRAFSQVCPADYCFIVTHRIYCHSWRINVNVNSAISEDIRRDIAILG